MDFTLTTYRRLLENLKEQGYMFQRFDECLQKPVEKVIILRHDVDRLPENSLVTAQIENEMGISGTYYFRAGKEGFDGEAIRQIAGMGHEIGYHYEDFVLARQKIKVTRQKSKKKDHSDLQDCKTARLQDCKTARLQDCKTARLQDYEKQLAEAAIVSFESNLNKLRQLSPVRTICMHGSPLSKWDSRLLWKYYDYRDYGITGESYFDVDFGEVLYLTDTGRRWDGDSVNIRDKAEKRRGEGEKRRAGEVITPSPVPPLSLSSSIRLRSTSDIINAARENKLPVKIMLTVHPQRWTDKPVPWVWELVWQNVKNLGKYLLIRRRKSEDRRRKKER